MKMGDDILRKTLQDLDGQDWGDPTYPSHLVTECHRLRQVPLETFDAENLRIIIGQKFSLEYLIPLALDMLLQGPWVSGDYYEGDLLNNVLSVPELFWRSNPELKHIVDQIVEKALIEFEEADAEGKAHFERHVVHDCQVWQRHSYSNQTMNNLQFSRSERSGPAVE